jgi:hypothetical protein
MEICSHPHRCYYYFPYLSGYHISLEAGRQVTSITLPAQGKINILAMTLVE